MKNVFFILLVSIISTSVFSQNTVLSGVIKDSLQNSLPYANVIAKPKDPSKNLQYAITDDEGYYKLLFTKGDTLSINISYIGFKSINYQFIAIENTKKDFILQESSEQLTEVVIEMPITIKGDTTIYKTDKFVDGS